MCDPDCASIVIQIPSVVIQTVCFDLIVIQTFYLLIQTILIVIRIVSVCSNHLSINFTVQAWMKLYEPFQDFMLIKTCKLCCGKFYKYMYKGGSLSSDTNFLWNSCISRFVEHTYSNTWFTELTLVHMRMTHYILTYCIYTRACAPLQIFVFCCFSLGGERRERRYEKGGQERERQGCGKWSRGKLRHAYIARLYWSYHMCTFHFVPLICFFFFLFTNVTNCVINDLLLLLRTVRYLM